MPFTLAHPAAALPLRRRLGLFGSTPALALGAMIPDLAYFLPLGVSGPQTHSVGGLFWFCLPAGMLACAAYHVVVRPFMVALVPATVSARLGAGGRIRWSGISLLRAAVSVTVAASTHVAWDSFTHSTGAAVQALAVLRQPVPLLPGYTPFVFTLLQHTSTLTGLTVLACWGIRWFRRAKPSEQVDARTLHTAVRLLLIIAWVLPSATAGGLVLWVRVSSGQALFTVLQHNLARAIRSAGTVFLSVFMVSALAWRAWDARFRVGRGGPTQCS